MDRLLFATPANKYFQISATKFHTAIGYYTNEFHRARYFPTATGVPILFRDRERRRYSSHPQHWADCYRCDTVRHRRTPLGGRGKQRCGGAEQQFRADPELCRRRQRQGGQLRGLPARPEWAPGVDVGVFLSRSPASGQFGGHRAAHLSAHAALVKTPIWN